MGLCLQARDEMLERYGELTVDVSPVAYANNFGASSPLVSGAGGGAGGGAAAAALAALAALPLQFASSALSCASESNQPSL